MAPNMHLAIQGAILNSIDQPSFSAALPPLSDRSWVNILGTSPATHRENERLEFLGDALMYATLGRHLYKEIPEGDPGLFTVCFVPLLKSCLQLLLEYPLRSALQCHFFVFGGETGYLRCQR